MLDLDKVCDIEFENIDWSDAYDFCDAYISKAYYEEPENEFRELTNDELDQIMDEHGDWVYEKLMDWIH